MNYKIAMKGILIILILQIFAISMAHSQSITVDDLLTLASTPSKKIDHFMEKKGFYLSASSTDSINMEARFVIKVKFKKTYSGPKRSIDIVLKNDSKYFTLHTSSLSEYVDGKQNLIKAGFFYDTKKDIKGESSMLFQKENITIRAISEEHDSVPQYTFVLQQKKIPHAIKYAEDLLQFDSHEFLVSFFGEQNVKKDMYYFSEKELKKCSVLFSGTRYQVVFVWGDENNLTDLAYILIPHVLPTRGAENNNPVTGNNEWQFRNGIYPGMDIKELLKLNETDFGIYGNTSEFAFMAKPMENGRIDFTKTAVMLSCNNCNDIKMFNQREVSAMDVAKKDLPMYVNDVIIYPAHH